MESRLEEHCHLNRQSSSQPGVILLFQGYWQCLETLLIVTGRGRRILLFSGWRLGRLLNLCCCVWPQSSFGFFCMLEWKARSFGEPNTMYRTVPTTKNDLVKLSVEPRWNTPGIDLYHSYFPCTTIILLIPLINHCSSQTMVFLFPLPPS